MIRDIHLIETFIFGGINLKHHRMCIIPQHCGWERFHAALTILAPNSHFTSLQRDHHLVVANEGGLWAVQGDLHLFLHTWTMKTWADYSWTGIITPCKHTDRAGVDVGQNTHAVERLWSRSFESWGKLRMVERSGWGTAMNSQQTPPRHLHVMHHNVDTVELLTWQLPYAIQLQLRNKFYFVMLLRVVNFRFAYSTL